MYRKIGKIGLILGINFIGIKLVLDILFNRIFLDERIMKRYIDLTEYNLDMVKWWQIKNDLLVFLMIVVSMCGVWTLLIKKYVSEKSIKETLSTMFGILRKIERGERIGNLYGSRYEEIVNSGNRIATILVKQRKDMDREIERKKELIAYLTHDLKTPLTSIIGYLRLLQDQKNKDIKEGEKYIGKALQQTYRLEKLMDELFEITKFNIKSNPLKKEKINLCYMLIQILDEFYPMFNQKDIKVYTEVDSNIDLYVDAGKIARAINNILRNAVIYCRVGGNIQVRAIRQEKTVEIAIENEGEEISKENLEKIFEKFFRVDEARGNQGGAGLGLAIAKEIIEQHKGYIYAFSNENRTIFKIVLPYEI